MRSEEPLNTVLIAMIVVVATIGGFMFGYDSGVINGTQAGLESAFNLAALGTGITVGAILVGSAVGAFGAGRLADRAGRRGVMRGAAMLFIVSAIGTGASSSATMFVLFRLLGGLGIGAASVIAPVYISEMVPAAIRGRLSSVQQIMILIGVTGAFTANFCLARIAGVSTNPLWFELPAWRWMFWMQVLPAAIFYVSLFLIPESPRYLVIRGRSAEAEQVLGRLFGYRAAQKKVAEIVSSLAGDHHRPRLSDLLEPRTRRIRPLVWTGIGLAVFQQFVGINIVFYYGALLWQSVGFSEKDSLLINILSGALSILACLGTVLLVDRIGRKPLLLTGSFGMTLALGTMAYLFARNGTVGGGLHLAGNDGFAALVAANIYVIFFNLSWGPVMWVMLGEMFPNQIRGSGLAVSGFAQWIANFAISVSFPTLVAGVGLGPTYGFYAASALLSLFFVWALVRETKGMELEQMAG